jgi:hypothetical protein
MVKAGGFGRVLALVALFATSAHAIQKSEPRPAQKEMKLDGYLEFRHGDLLVVEGYRVRIAPGATFKSQGASKSAASIPLGYEVKAKGFLQPDGLVLAHELEAKPNAGALFEAPIKQATDEMESQFRRAGRVFQANAKGGMENIGRILESGPELERARRIMDSLIPPYLKPDDVRVYVVENKEWNAFAMGNFAIYVFTGLMRDLDDDELALVLSHELVHASHEHTRRQMKRDMWAQIAALGVSAAAETIDSNTKRAVAQLATQLAATTYSNGFGRDLEDQADQVGVRYAYEAGYDISKAPNLWQRFAKKYGEPGRVVNFFFGDHSRSSARAANLKREIALQYQDAPTARPVRRDAAASPADGPPAPPRPPARPPQTTTALAPPSASSQTIKAGMTPDEVRRVLGEPQEELAFGTRTRWTYPDLTVVFENGRVASVRF